ncbi:hypothetical protein RB195_007425 [Necator americanus]|uniref:Cation transporter family protein n=1 Tax=Necator americanus TaxID=51031 RepID=A0ABR1BXB3_NECAM
MYLLIPLIITVNCAEASHAEAELYRNLLKNYSAAVRPVRNPNRVLTVSMKIFLQQILNVDEQDQVIEVNAWLKYIWHDYRLRWRPIAYENITSVRFPGDEQQIWQPDILLYNSANERFDSTYKSNLVVYSNGQVNWIPPGIFRITCKMDITMFPFDEQICFLKFGSWTYHGFALDLSLEDQENSEPSMDISTYISNGEWQLVNAPARKEVTYYQCCPEPYPTIKFYMHLKRRSLYHMFNIITPSLLISGMTVLGFCLPAHDMSEKIGFQTTILLSVCFFLTILSEMTPITSESIPLLGIFFSSVTLVVTMSTTFTVSVLNVRYRDHANHKMPRTMRYVFIELIPWLLLMKRPGYRFSSGKGVSKDSSNDSHCVQCALRDGGDLSFSCSELDVDNPEVLNSTLQTIPGEKLELSRKVGEGLFVPRKCESSRKHRVERCERYVNKCKQLSAATTESQHLMLILDLYVLISRRLRGLRERLDDNIVKRETIEEWKFAALALDRLCLYLFGILLIVCIVSIFIIDPVTQVKPFP